MTGQPVRDYRATRVGLELDPLYAEVRGREPVARVRFPDGREGWLVTGYEYARQILADARFSRAVAAARSPVGWRELYLTDMDHPEHTRIRRMVVDALPRRRVERQLAPRVRQIADGLIDDLLAQGPPADVLNDFALPLTVTVICELLGVPPADRARFGELTRAFLATTPSPAARPADAYDQLSDYFASLVAERRARPTADLFGELAQARDEAGDRLSESELIALGKGLLTAAFETTANQLANSVYVLLTHPDQLRRLRQDPRLLPGAVEELLRWVPLGDGAGLPRVAIEDIRLGDVLIRAGDAVFAARPAANRDETVFPDADSVDIGRRPQYPHLTFSHGIHHCVGSHLARVELQVGLGAVLGRLPRFRFAVAEEELRWKRGPLVRGLEELPIVWDD
jgi:cytochrome P450